MTPSRWQQIEELYHAALECEHLLSHLIERVAGEIENAHAEAAQDIAQRL